MVNRPGGEESTQLLLVLLLSAERPAGACTDALFGLSELLDRKRAVFFFGFSTVDFDLGRPTLGTDVSAAALATAAFFTEGVAPSWASRLSRSAMGEGVPDRLPEPPIPLCC